MPDLLGDHLPHLHWLLLTTVFVLLAALGLSRIPLQSQILVARLILMLVFGGLLAVGCNGVGSGTAQPPPSPQGTPAGTYTVVVTVSAQGASRPVNLTLKVN